MALGPVPKDQKKRIDRQETEKAKGTHDKLPKPPIKYRRNRGGANFKAVCTHNSAIIYIYIFLHIHVYIHIYMHICAYSL